MLLWDTIRSQHRSIYIASAVPRRPLQLRIEILYATSRRCLRNGTLFNLVPLPYIGHFRHHGIFALGVHRKTKRMTVVAFTTLALDEDRYQLLISEAQRRWRRQKAAAESGSNGAGGQFVFSFSCFLLAFGMGASVPSPLAETHCSYNDAKKGWRLLSPERSIRGCVASSEL